jgi:hypothetical protein
VRLIAFSVTSLPPADKFPPSSLWRYRVGFELFGRGIAFIWGGTGEHAGLLWQSIPSRSGNWIWKRRRAA